MFLRFGIVSKLVVLLAAVQYRVNYQVVYTSEGRFRHDPQWLCPDDCQRRLMVCGEPSMLLTGGVMFDGPFQ